MGGKTSTASKNKYNAKAYDRLNVVVKKGMKPLIKELAENMDMSTNALIIYALEKVAQENNFDLTVK
ncbi:MULTISPECIES: antitoxin [Porcipelethomonas]|uniref:antitoxin n=1 Tax=Porcipelethomonas TaxID=2981643 RepID=UPI000821C551|nr:antitoxin [Porcipelethomonas ammoniilytica]MCU6720751.1 antitoxin [Porcipelethomonas ammoniilytica]SCJ23970.1 Uncharacterised protein [uncultured Ruminococcus sp.]